MKNIVMKNKKFSLVETVVYIIVLPLCIYMGSSLLINVNSITKNINERIRLYSDMNIIIPLIHKDFLTCYKLDIKDNGFILSNEDGEINYEINQNYIYRNRKRVGNIKGIDIRDISTSSNKYPLYEITIYSEVNKSEVSIPTKVSMPTLK